MSLTKQLKEKLSLAVANIKIPTRFPDMVYTVDLSLDDCYYGCRKSVTVKTTNLCHCSQSWRPGENEKKECNLSRVDVQEGIEYNVCDTFEEYKLDIIPGTEHDSKLVFKQKGCQSYTNKIFSGDLIIKLNVTDENDEISIKGCNIYLKIEIDILIVLFGKYINVKYFDQNFDIHTSEFPDEIIEENKEYTLANLGVKTGENEKGNLTIMFKYNYENVKKLATNKKQEILNILEN